MSPTLCKLKMIPTAYPDRPNTDADQFELSLFNKKFCAYVCQDTGCDRIEFDNSLVIPDIKGKVIKVYGKSLKSRKKAARIIVEEMMASKKKKIGDHTTVLALIPEGMVSLVIGAKGRQIKILTQDSGTDIVVNQPIHRMSLRTVKIDGQPKNISRAIAMIYALLEDRAEDFR